MSAKVTINLNSNGIRALLASQPVSDVLKEHAEAIAARAGDGFEPVGPQRMRKDGRAAWGVAAKTYEAKYAEATDKALLKAVR